MSNVSQMKNVGAYLTPKFTIRPIRATSTQTGTGVDRQGFLSALLVLEVGTVSGTSPTLDVKLQDSADDSTYADVSGETLAQVTATGASKSKSVDMTSLRRYVRAVGTIAGTTPSFDFGVELVLGGDDVV